MKILDDIWSLCPLCLYRYSGSYGCPYDPDEIEDFMGKSHMISCDEFYDTCLINVRITYD